MSQAFVKENDDNGMLHQVDPTLSSLINYLRSESGGKGIHLERWDKINDTDIAVMSNGFSYFINSDKQWEIIL